MLRATATLGENILAWPIWKENFKILLVKTAHFGVLYYTRELANLYKIFTVKNMDCR